jgi:hypothetical protein
LLLEGSRQLGTGIVEKGHRVYQALYPALKPIYRQIAAL